MERRTPIDNLRMLAKEGTETGRRLRVAEAVFNGMMSAYQNHISLGEDGKKQDAINQFGENALMADFQAESQILRSLDKWVERYDLLLRYWAEEHGERVITGDRGPIQKRYDEEKRYSTAIDGLDGSDNYLNDTPWSYGTMVAVAKGEDPTYDDFEIAGVMMPEEGWIILAVKHLGVWVYDTKKQTSTPLPRFSPDEAFDKEKILADNPFPEAQEILGKWQEIWSRTGSTAASIVAIAVGNNIKAKHDKMNTGWQGLFEVTRKGNLEQPTIYRIITELGGFMVDESGVSIGAKTFKEWGQEKKVPVITARSSEVVRGIREELGL